MKVVLLRGDFSETDLRHILRVCRMIENQKQQPVWYSVVEGSTRDVLRQIASETVTYTPVSNDPPESC